MKKISLLVLLFIFLSVNFAVARSAEAVSALDTKTEIVKSQTEKNDVENVDGSILSILKSKVTSKYQKYNSIFDKVSEKIKNAPESMRTAIILMVVGLIFLIIASAGIGGSIVWAVGAIFFILGALMLLLELL